MNHEQYWQLLLQSKSDIEKDTQMRILKYLFDKFVQYNKDLLMLNDGYINRITSRVQFETMVKMDIEINFDIKIYVWDAENNCYKWNIKIKDIYNTIVSVNQFALLRYRSDLFAPKQIIEKDNNSSEITVIGNKLNIRKLETTIIKEEFSEIIKDYKKHFKYFDELLDLIIDMRFAKDRKASFLHLRVKSDWGKSFLSGLLKNINIAFEVDYHNLMNKGANDIAPIQVRNSFVLILDEFNNFSAEMKKLSHSFAFAQKFGMREDIELYLKILMSAEKSPSFTGGVDAQIVNRVMVMDIEDNEATPLVGRELYTKYGNAKYMEALEYYTSQRLIKKVNAYLSLEKFEAHKKADIAVRKAVKKYKMKDIESITDAMSHTIYEVIRGILKAGYSESMNGPFKSIVDNIIKINTGIYKDKIFIKSPKKTFETILKLNESESDFKKMKYKLSNFEDILIVVANHMRNKHRINKGEPIRGLVIDLPIEAPEKIPLTIEDENGNVRDAGYIGDGIKAVTLIPSDNDF